MQCQEWGRRSGRISFLWLHLFDLFTGEKLRFWVLRPSGKAPRIRGEPLPPAAWGKIWGKIGTSGGARASASPSPDAWGKIGVRLARLVVLDSLTLSRGKSSERGSAFLHLFDLFVRRRAGRC